MSSFNNIDNIFYEIVSNCNTLEKRNLVSALRKYKKNSLLTQCRKQTQESCQTIDKLISVLEAHNTDDIVKKLSKNSIKNIPIEDIKLYIIDILNKISNPVYNVTILAGTLKDLISND